MAASGLVQVALAALLGAAAVGGVQLAGRDQELVAQGQSTCVIKGNVSINSGEHIYHVPGQRDYDATRISPEYGERWFCSESEARAAGWRRAGI